MLKLSSLEAVTPRLWLSLAGTFQASDEEGRSVLPRSGKARALLCLLGMQRPRGLRRSVAASLLWSASHKADRVNLLRGALRDLRAALAPCGHPPLITAKSSQLVLQPGSAWIDIFEPNRVQGHAEGEAVPGFDALCQDLQGLDPAFDRYLEGLWTEVEFRNALKWVPGSSATPDGPGHARATRGEAQMTSQKHAADSGAHLRMHAPATSTGLAMDMLNRFPEAISATAVVPKHQLGWRMAVLPFRSLGASLGHGLSLGMAEEISAALARFRAPRLVATVSFWDGIGPAVDAMGRCRAYGLDYVIDGMIQVVDSQVRVIVTLLDVVLDFEVAWSARFDGSLDDLFSLQDRIAAETVAQVDPDLFGQQRFSPTVAKTSVAEAHRAVLTAIRSIFRLDQLKFMRARELLARAIELDPGYAGAHAWMAYWSIMAVGQGWVDDPQDVIELAGRAAERATVLDPLDARGLAVAAHVKAYLLHDVKGALALHARAVELNPNLPIAWAMSSWSKIYSGDHGTAVRQAMTAQALSPRDPHLFFFEHAQMTAHFFRRQLVDAETLAEVVLARNPNHVSALNVYLAILGHMGRKAEAAYHLERLRAIDPDVSIGRIAGRVPLQAQDQAYYRKGLSCAGVPE